MDRPRMTITAVVLDSPDANELAGFYQRLLGWPRRADEPGWVALRAPDGRAGLSFQTEDAYVRPRWPAGGGGQQRPTGRDPEGGGRAAAGAHGKAGGGALGQFEPHREVRVY